MSKPALTIDRQGNDLVLNVDGKVLHVVPSTPEGAKELRRTSALISDLVAMAKPRGTRVSTRVMMVAADLALILGALTLLVVGASVNESPLGFGVFAVGFIGFVASIFNALVGPGRDYVISRRDPVARRVRFIPHGADGKADKRLELAFENRKLGETRCLEFDFNVKDDPVEVLSTLHRLLADEEPYILAAWDRTGPVRGEALLDIVEQESLVCHANDVPAAGMGGRDRDVADRLAQRITRADRNVEEGHAR